MALGLEIGTIKQSNDNKTLYITDGTGVYNAGSNPTGWGTPNTQLSEIDGSTSALTLQITITTSDGTETEYTAVDFYTSNSNAAPATVDDIVFEITCADLIDNDGDALGTADDELPDGWYSFEYSIDHNLTSGLGDTDTDTDTKVIAGIVRNEIFTTLLSIPYHKVLAKESKVYSTKEIDLYFPLYVKALFESMLAYQTASRKNEILGQLELLENLLSL